MRLLWQARCLRLKLYAQQFTLRMNRGQLKSFKIANENQKLLRIFEILGFLPSKEGNLINIIKSLLLIALIVVLILLKIFFSEHEKCYDALFGVEIAATLIEQLVAWTNVKLQTEFFIVLGEIDEKITTSLNMSGQLQKKNVKMHRILVATWFVFVAGSLYFPASGFIAKGFSSTSIVDSFFQFFSWSLFVHVNELKFLFFYAIIAVRLSVICQCLDDMQRDKVSRRLLLVNEFLGAKAPRFIEQHARLIVVKDIYHRIWRLQSLAYELSGTFLFMYLICYFAELAQFTLITIKIELIQGTLMKNLFELVFWLFLINIFIVALFALSRFLMRKGSTIAGLIHNISHDDNETLRETVKMFALQVIQQPITAISINSFLDFDRTNLNAVNFSLLIFSLTQFYLTIFLSYLSFIQLFPMK